MLKKKINLSLILFSLFVVLSFNAQAALRVQSGSFSCTGQAGVVLGETFSCQATNENPDGDAASITTVTLNVNGNWLEQTSYAGSGFSSTVSANGGTTTATFSGLRSTSSGGENAFSNVRIDSVTDTTITGVTVNVIDIQALNTITSVSSANRNAVFTVTAALTAGGSVDASLRFSGCTLDTGDSTTKNLGSLSHNAQGSASWYVVMGTSSCSYTITGTASKSGASTSETATGSVSCGDCSSSSSSSGGGGGGGITILKKEVPKAQVIPNPALPSSFGDGSSETKEESIPEPEKDTAESDESELNKGIAGAIKEGIGKVSEAVEDLVGMAFGIIGLNKKTGAFSVLLLLLIVLGVLIYKMSRLNKKTDNKEGSPLLQQEKDMPRNKKK
ncbi:hypothetical protein HZA96_07210 [Candidatus Woesearchaeota archaeon]|nr:hypothetical protein [Candidatus Woesearchaeota archaeon]